jgi:hypothetical protein
MAHIEIIKPHERIDPSLGGTGYLAPSQPSSLADLRADLEQSKTLFPQLGVSVWKVKCESHSQPPPLRLTLPNGRYLKVAHVLGGTGRVAEGWYWWFVSVSVADGLRALTTD